MDFAVRKTTEGHDFGIVWGQKKLADLDFADDVALLCHTQQALQDMTNRLHIFGKKVELRISGTKTKAMTVGYHITNHSGRTEHREGRQVPVLRKLPVREWRC